MDFEGSLPRLRKGLSQGPLKLQGCTTNYTELFSFGEHPFSGWMVEIMREIEFRVPKQCNLAIAETVIERACAKSGLVVAMKGSLASYPASVHWHYKKEKEKGTLELTLYRKASRIWAQVQDGRRADWIDLELPRLRRTIEGELRHALRGSSAPKGESARRK